MVMNMLLAVVFVEKKVPKKKKRKKKKKVKSKSSISDLVYL